MKVDQYGNLYFEPGESLPVLSMYQPDPIIENKYIPKFDFPCKARLFIGTVKPCSKRFAFLWLCNKFNRTTSIKDCGVCDAPDQPGQKSTESTIISSDELTRKLS